MHINIVNKNQNMPSIKVKFPGGSGHTLDGRLEMPDSPPKAYAICCHCFTCSKDTLTTYRISKAMAKKGYATLRFDFTGLGSSDGKFSKTGFSNNVADVPSTAIAATLSESIFSVISERQVQTAFHHRFASCSTLLLISLPLRIGSDKLTTALP